MDLKVAYLKRSLDPWTHFYDEPDIKLARYLALVLDWIPAIRKKPDTEVYTRPDAGYLAKHPAGKG